MIVHVSPDGNDRNSGTGKFPLATLKAARDALRRTRPGAAKRIVVHGGRYYNVSLRLGPEDSGLTIEAAPGEKPVLCGGRPLRAKWHRDGDRFYAAKLPGVKEGRRDFRHLLVDGKFAARACLPREGYMVHDSVWDVPLIPIGEGCNWARQPTRRELTTLRFRRGDLPENLDVRNAEFFVRHLFDDSIVKARRIDRSTRTVWFASPCVWPPGAYHGWNERVQWYRVVNVRAGMQEPGQWYLDRRRGRLVYWPKPHEDPELAEILVPTTRSILRIESTKAAPAEDITVRGLAFTGATAKVESPAWGGHRMDGAVGVTGGRGLAFENLTFHQVGGTGIRARGSAKSKYASAADGLSDVCIRGCRFEKCGGAGAYVWGHRCVVADNVFHQIGLDYVGSVGLCVDGGRCRIRGNEIRGVPYVGIAAGGKNGRIENNVVREYMQDGEDGGAYYVYGKTRNYLVRGNAAYGPPGRAMAHAYYTDEFSADHRIEGNLAVNARWPLHTHISSGHRIVNNVFVDRGPSKITLTRSHGMRFERNIICAGGSITIHMRPDGISAMPNNIFFCRRGTLRVGWLAKQEYHTLKTEAFPLRDGSILADPLFTDASRGEYSFKRRSPAHDLGIRPIGVSPQITN